MVVGLFEDGWYIGKAREIIAKGDRVKIKFMEDRNFKVTQRFWKWPRVNDVQVWWSWREYYSISFGSSGDSRGLGVFD